MSESLFFHQLFFCNAAASSHLVGMFPDENHTARHTRLELDLDQLCTPTINDALLFLQAVGDKHRLEPMLIVVAGWLVGRSVGRGKMAYICHGNEHFVLGGPAYFALPYLASNMEPSP